MIKQKLRKLLWRTGYNISRFTPKSHPLARRKQILNDYNIDTVLDIGANSGQFALQLRKDLDYEKRMISFEPLSSAFKLLKTNAERDPNWEVLNIALGDTEEKREIYIAGNSESSSLLAMLPAHLKSVPGSRCTGRELIEVKSLDSIFGDLCKPTNRIYMKMDTQGYEGRILKGAEKSLKWIDTVQMEMSLVPLYEGELLFYEMCEFMGEKKYDLIAIEAGYSDPDTSQIMQVDGIFHRFSV